MNANMRAVGTHFGYRRSSRAAQRDHRLGRTDEELHNREQKIAVFRNMNAASGICFITLHPGTRPTRASFQLRVGTPVATAFVACPWSSRDREDSGVVSGRRTDFMRASTPRSFLVCRQRQNRSLHKAPAAFSYWKFWDPGDLGFGC